MPTGLFNLKQVNQAISQGAWSGYIAPKWVEYLVVAGGGGAVRGGGGGGGLLTGIVTVAAGTSYTVTVGSGGTGRSINGNITGGNGNNSVFGAITSNGGGGGGADVNGTIPGLYGASGGSGGGGGATAATGVALGGGGIVNQGNSGGSNGGFNGNPYPSGGGGGAGTVGLNASGNSIAGNGGAGIASAISGAVTTYAGGGGGGIYDSSGTVGTGGVGGGGNANVSSNGASGSSNLGGGGGGGPVGATGGNGGSGIVVVRYPGSVQFFTGGTLSYANGYMIHTFYASGTLAPTTPTPYVTDYQISRSLRFNRSDSAYLTRTPSSTGSRTTYTLSFWTKLGNLATGADSFMWSSGDTTVGDAPALLWKTFSGTCTFIFTAGTSTDVTTSAVYRDPSAWYHVVVAVDTTQATSTNRIKMYVNGVQVTFSSATYPSQNLSYNVNTSSYPAYLGALNISGSPARYYEGYQTEINFIDGSQLTPSSFGYTNPATGVWSPLAFVGTYGTNGFYLNFSDNSNTTAATLGKDYSGNGNNWTPNNFSVTAGAGNDSLVDSPTSYGTDTGVGGTVRGNYATLNPLDKLSTVTAPLNGNLQYNTANSTGLMRGTLGVKSAKWYYEATITAVPSAGSVYIGVKDSADPTMTSSNGLGSNSGTTNEFGYSQSGISQNNGSTVTVGTLLIAGDVLMVAYDLDSGKIWWGKNGTWISSGDPATGANAMYSTLTSSNGYSPAIGYNFTFTDGIVNCNFGQRPFAYTAPSGFKALCTQNLPTPTIGATTATLAGKFFNPVLWTGNGSTQTISGVGFQPDFTWAKCRSNAATANILQDVIRGAGSTLFSEDTSGQLGNSGDLITSWNSDGFGVNRNFLGGSSNNSTNGSGYTYVAWNWKANGSGSSNTAGSITSTVSANTTSGFSVVTYGGNGANSTIGHGIGTAPSMVIVKRRGASDAWIVYHASLGNTNLMVLNSTAAVSTSSAYWNNTSPTSTVFTVGTATEVNANGSTYVAYCFAPVAGYSKFGSYTGNGSADGPFVYTGFRPAYVMFKITSGVDSWVIYDTKRNTYNVVNNQLYPNSSGAESAAGASFYVDFVSNGFKVRATDTLLNGNGSTYIFAAFAEAPLKFSLAR